MKPTIRTIVFLTIIGLNIAADQITKVIVRNEVTEGTWSKVMGEFILLTRVENTGAMLSAGSNLPPVLRSIFIIWLPLLMISALFVYILVRRKKLDMVTLGLLFVTGGGIGNIFDRIMYGSVTDFLIMGWEFARTGIFNIADVSVMVGVGMIMVGSYFFTSQVEPVIASDIAS